MQKVYLYDVIIDDRRAARVKALSPSAAANAAELLPGESCMVYDTDDARHFKRPPVAAIIETEANGNAIETMTGPPPPIPPAPIPQRPERPQVDGGHHHA